MKIHWATANHDLAGNALGYATHVKFLRKYAEKIIDFVPDAEIALQICPADFFRYIPGKLNVLFTMWEFLEVPNKYIGNLQRADVIIVPSSFCKDLFRKYTDRPIYVCHEGVEAESFPYIERHFPKSEEKFRFLWVGAPNPRKGYPLILEAVKMLADHPRVEMYIKTTMQKIDRSEFKKNLFRQRARIRAEHDGKENFKRMLDHANSPEWDQEVEYLGAHKNVIFDRRKLSTEGLAALYGSAHCFLLPTYGEGWGLTLCEAMATGAPSIATDITGCKDFFNSDVGYPIGHLFAEQCLTNYNNLIAMGYAPSYNDMLRKMFHVFNNYPEALKKGKKASDLIRRKFTWEISANRLKNILEEIEAKHLCAK